MPGMAQVLTQPATQVVEAVYENGVLRPLQPLELDEHARVRLTVASPRGLTAAGAPARPVAPVRGGVLVVGLDAGVSNEIALSHEFTPEEA